MLNDASDYMWRNYGIPVGTPEYNWSKDELIETATRNGWKFSFY